MEFITGSEYSPKSSKVRVVDGGTRNAPSSEPMFRIYLICPDDAERVYDITHKEWEAIAKTKPEDMSFGLEFISERYFQSRKIRITTEGSGSTYDPMLFRIHVFIPSGEFSRAISYEDWKRIAKTI